MEKNETALELDKKIYEELKRVCNGVLSLRSDLLKLSYSTSFTVQSVSSLKVQNILLKNAITCLEEIQQFREDQGFISYKASEDVLKHQIDSLSDTFNLVDKTYTEIEQNLDDLVTLSDKIEESVNLLVNGKVLNIFSAETKLN